MSKFELPKTQFVETVR